MIRFLPGSILIAFILFSFQPPPGSRSRVFFIKRAGLNPVQVGKPMQTGLYQCDSTERGSHPVGWKNIIATHFVMSPDRKTWYLSAGNGVLKSTDNGKSFRIITDWKITEVLYTWINPKNPRSLIACTATGLFRSYDEGKTWTESGKGLSRPGEKYCEQLITYPGDTSQLYIATAEGFFTSSDGGNNWTSWAFRGKETVALDLSQGKNQVIAVVGKNIFITTNGGVNWEMCFAGKNKLLGLTRVPGDASRLFAYGTGTGLLFSQDNCRNWSIADNELKGKTIFSLCLSQDSKKMYAGTDEGLWVSVNGGKNFTRQTEWDGRITYVWSEE